MKAVEHLHFTRQTVKELKAEIARLRAALEEIVSTWGLENDDVGRAIVNARKVLANEQLKT